MKLFCARFEMEFTVTVKIFLPTKKKKKCSWETISFCSRLEKSRRVFLSVWISGYFETAYQSCKVFHCFKVFNQSFQNSEALFRAEYVNAGVVL